MGSNEVFFDNRNRLLYCFFTVFSGVAFPFFSGTNTSSVKKYFGILYTFNTQINCMGNMIVFITEDERDQAFVGKFSVMLADIPNFILAVSGDF